MSKNKKLFVVALGGNALLLKGEKGKTSEHEKNCKNTINKLFFLIKEGHNLIITHGNGPQVGNILIQNEEAKHKVPDQPIDTCVAKTQGSIGYFLQQAVLNKLLKEKINRTVVTVVTQVLVDINDKAFNNPTKPVGPFYTKEESETLTKEKSWTMIEDSGRGYRRVVASPYPLEVIQKNSIKELAEYGNIVIAVGGGGIPIYKNKNNTYKGAEAVIDKDLASSNLASEVNSDEFIILTQVPNIFLNFNKPDEKAIYEITLTEAKSLLSEGHFPSGSMGPKIQASIDYIEKTKKSVLITSIDEINNAITGKAGTRITYG